VGLVKIKHILELLICSAIGGYCAMRVWQLMPSAYDELMAVTAAAFGRVRDIEAAIDEATE
jgi:FlaG/FlaF family flagellin (archaellin)